MLGLAHFLPAKTRHFQSHDGSISGIEIKHRVKLRIMGIIHIGSQEGPAPVAITEMVHVHMEKGQVRRDIPVSKAIIEFNAINDLNALIIVDMIGAQITVTVANAAGFNTPLEKMAPTFKKRTADLTDELPFFPFPLVMAAVSAYSIRW